MKICGLQKLTLLDYPGHVACTVFTGGCNLRCPFCHNTSLITGAEEFMSEDELLAFLSKRHGILDGVAVTGGEPLLHRETADLLAKIKETGYLVKLDTNGTFPSRLREIVEAGLVDYVAVDVKNSKEKYAETVGVKNFDISPIEETVEYLLTSPVEYEFRTTVVSPYHAPDDIEAIAKWIRGAKRYFLQSYIDSGDVLHADGLSALPKKTLEEAAKTASAYVEFASVRGV